jgi:hypothetical protein
MTVENFFKALQEAGTVAEVEQALDIFRSSHGSELAWAPVGGRKNNRGTIDVSTDSGRSLVERLTNGIDAILEAEHVRHHGVPNCRSPKEAAVAWIGVPEGGLSSLSPVQRRSLGQKLAIRLLPGEGRDSRTIEVRDLGTGLTPQQMPNTILSLNESNKMQKHYVVGVYGQGGSSTFAWARYTLIASRFVNHPTIGFTLVRFDDLPPEEYKTGNYVYLTQNDSVLQLELPVEEFVAGTQIKHFGYDLSSYDSPVGPGSLYGLLNRILFDPVLPVWLDNRIRNYRRIIKGSRNALNGAVDEGDENRRGPELSHHIPMFFVPIADHGNIGIEYWVLQHPTSENKVPTAAFVNPGKPIVMTLNGQNHAELSRTLVKKEAALPYLAQRLICHVDCNSLTAQAKRALFASTREEARRGLIYNMIEQEVIRVLKSDDELIRLNNEARERGLHERDEATTQEMRREVARLLRIHGIEVAELVGGEVVEGGRNNDRPTHPRPPRPQPQPIDLHEPPTYIRILWDEGEPITFYGDQRRYLRIETDATSSYHDASNAHASRINVIVSSGDVVLRGTTSLNGGRMRAIFECPANSNVSAAGTIRVELARQGLPTLFDQRNFEIVEAPPIRPSSRQVSLPPFKILPVDGPTDTMWATLDWPEDVNGVASSAVMDNGTLTIYYSKVFPKYLTRREVLERRDPSLAASFVKRYEIWLAVHSFLLYQDQQSSSDTTGVTGQHVDSDDSEIAEVRERQERCRIATLAAIFASREVRSQVAVTDSE